MESLEPFDFSEAVDFSMAYLSGYLADKYDVSSDECNERANERVKRSSDLVYKAPYRAMTPLFPRMCPCSFPAVGSTMRSTPCGYSTPHGTARNTPLQ